MLGHALNTRNHKIVPITLVPAVIFGHGDAAHTLRRAQTNYKVQNVPSCALITKNGHFKRHSHNAVFDCTVEGEGGILAFGCWFRPLEEKFGGLDC